MNLTSLYNHSILLIFVFAVIVFILLFFIPAPYGKFSRIGWGPALKAKWAWMIMELPSPAIVVTFFILSENKGTPQIIFLSIWLLHYLHRTFIYPFSQSGRNKPYPLVVVLMAIVFNSLNGFVNGYGVFNVYSYDNSWPGSWQFLSGITLFVAGFVINKTADSKLSLFRRTNPSEYVLPQGWLFNFISCPHYLGEIMEWGGWALLTWSVPGFAFFVFTFANLYPRAIASQKWYKEAFPDYPADRKAIFPFIV